MKYMSAFGRLVESDPKAILSPPFSLSLQDVVDAKQFCRHRFPSDEKDPLQEGHRYPTWDFVRRGIFSF